MIELLVVIEVVAIVMAIALPNIYAARRAANEAAAVGDLKAINDAELQYRARGSGYTQDLAGLSALNMIDPALAAATSSSSPRAGYYYAYSRVSGTQYYVLARPTATLGTRMFYSDESGVMWMSLSSGTVPSADSDGLAAPATGWSQIGN